MEERDRSRSPSRRTSRVEQVVGRWLRRSRDSTSRERVIEDGRAANTSPQEQRSCPIRVTAQIPFDSALNSHGFAVSTHTPPQVQEVAAGGPADGKLLPGDQLVKINNVAVDDLSTEQAADIIRECQDTITMTVLRITVGPKSSFITPEKRAKLRSNPVKVRFAEEVVVNGHSQGNSLLFLPNVLKVYLENGQTKAFKFEPKTTVKDIVMTLKEKLSISRIEHFSLVLEQQYSITKLFLLHEEELIQEVVQKKESHDYRCLFRVCFMPKEPDDMLEEDPVAFEYLYLQSVSDVLQERFAVEMKCNTALRLAALHIQERLASTGQSPKTPLKTVTKDWGIDSFVSSTLLRNMREKDLKKAISYHMKKILLQEPKQKVVTVNQARLNYLNEMGELKSYAGKSFSATMMLQDRESMVSLLVGAQYGVSQVINHKLSIMTTLTEFSSITRVELTPESERVSLVKIYLQDIKPITLLLESVAAKDFSCLIAGYCRLLVDPQICVFPWTAKSKSHRISAEEGYVSRCGSDSEDSDTDMDALLAHVASATQSDQQVSSTINSNNRAQDSGQAEEKAETRKEEDKTAKQSEVANGVVKITEKVRLEGHSGLMFANEEDTLQSEEEKDMDNEKEDTERELKVVPKIPCVIIVEDPPSDASDSCQTDSRFLASMSSDSMDALEEDDLLTYCSTSCPSHLDMGDHYLHSDVLLSSSSPRQLHCQESDFHNDLCSADADGDSDPFVCFAALSNIAECLPSPPEASEDEDYEDQAGEVEGQEEDASEEGSERTQGLHVFTFEQGDTRCYYKICSNLTPDSARSPPRPPSPNSQKEEEGNGTEEQRREPDPIPILQPPPGFGDSSSDDEFFDAQERFTSPEESSSTALSRENSTEYGTMKRTLSLSDIGISVCEQGMTEEELTGQKEYELRMEMSNELSRFNKRYRKRRSFMETDYTSLVSFPEDNCNQIANHRSGPDNKGEGPITRFDVGLSNQSPCPTVSSLNNAEGEPAQLETKPITPSRLSKPESQNLMDGNKVNKASQRKQQLMLMEPDSMEFKSVTEVISGVSPAIVALRTSGEPKANNINSSDLAEEGAVGDLLEGFLADHLFFSTSRSQGDSSLHVKTNDQESFKKGLSQDTLDKLKACSLPRLGQASLSGSLYLQVPTISCTPSPDVHREQDHLGMRNQKGQLQPTERIRSHSMSSAFGRRAPLCPTRHLFPQREPLFRTKEPESDDTDSSSDPSLQEVSSSVPSADPTQGYLFAPCSPGILGRLSASTLRGKIQNLPLYLSRSHEVLDGNESLSGIAKPARRFSETRPRRKDVDVLKEETEEVTSTGAASEVTELKVVTIVSEEVTEVIEEVREVSHNSPRVHGQQKAEAKPQEHPQASSPSPCPQSVAPAKISTSSVVVTTQNLNGPWGVVTSREIGGLQGGSGPLVGTHSHLLTSGCGVFTNCDSKPTNTQPKALPSPCPHGKPDLSCSSALAMGCETVMEGAQTPLEVCGCQAVYTNCFSGVLDSGSFDDELTVYEFSCRTQQEESGQAALMKSIPLPSSLSGSPASFSPSSPLPSFPCVVLPPSSSTELGPLLSPLHNHDCFLPDAHEDAIAGLLSRRYPLPPTGFLALQRDVDTLLTILAGAMKDQDGVLEHPRDTCAAHFSENKRRLHTEARGLLAGCQQVVRVEQTPAETLQALAESFHSLVQLTSVCLSFSSCQRCQERHTQALSGLADLAQTYQEFARAAEQVGTTTGKRTCHDLSIKLLARQCTALTTSVFCLTQLFRTLTAL
ncbi:FERM and PDZ domain-containing protein 1 [Astyanax mexicanus]|uniref:FERM and PDZ domain-containing protein 1 n=1 Tax=Astyanax mexicanus TaxID=7994 RepID=UPI0020CB50AC|nr:FERM and PDZ domain-containing protein 1 [Astyanax mexicanus]